MSHPVALVPPEPMRTGGGGSVIEVFLGLVAIVAAGLSALAWRDPRAEDLDEEPKREKTSPRGPPPPRPAGEGGEGESRTAAPSRPSNGTR